MKRPFEFTLEGRDWSRLYFWYWGPSLLLILLSLAVREPKAGDTAALLGSSLISLAISFLTMLLQSFFTVPILKTWLPRLSVDGKPFAFGGDTNDYLILNVKGFLLSVVTLGIYLPWYLRNVLDYLARETTFDGGAARFTGKPLRLLVVGLVSVVLLCLVAAIFAVQILKQGTLVSPLVVAGWTTVIVLVFTAPLVYLVYAWMIQFDWKGLALRWTTRFLPASGMVLGQVALTVLSLGLWWPGATLVLYRYFTRHTVVSEASGAVVRFRFEGSIGEGWKYLWAQALLTVVTLGFYGAWSGPNVTRWLATHTLVETAPFEGPSEP